MKDLVITITIPAANVERVLNTIAEAHRYDLAKQIERDKNGEIIAEESLEDFARRKCQEWWDDTVFQGERRVIIQKAQEKLRTDIKKIGIKVK